MIFFIAEKKKDNYSSNSKFEVCEVGKKRKEKRKGKWGIRSNKITNKLR